MVPSCLFFLWIIMSSFMNANKINIGMIIVLLITIGVELRTFSEAFMVNKKGSHNYAILSNHYLLCTLIIHFFILFGTMEGYHYIPKLIHPYQAIVLLLLIEFEINIVLTATGTTKKVLYSGFLVILFLIFASKNTMLMLFSLLFLPIVDWIASNECETLPIYSSLKENVPVLTEIEKHPKTAKVIIGGLTIILIAAKEITKVIIKFLPRNSTMGINYYPTYVLTNVLTLVSFIIILFFVMNGLAKNSKD